MQSAFKNLRFALFCLSLFSACNPVDLAAPKESTPRIVLLGELIAGDSMHFRAGRSRPLKDTRPVAELESDMQITVGYAGNLHALTAYDDEYLHTVFTTAFSSPALVQPQTDYIVKASNPGFSPVEASVKVPAAFDGIVSAEGPLVHLGDSMRSFHVGLNGLPSGTQYVVEVLRRSVNIVNSFWHDGYVYDYDQSRLLYDSLVGRGIPLTVIRDTTFPSLTVRQPFYSDRSSAENTKAGVARPYHWFFIRPEVAASLDFRLFIPMDKSGTHWQYVVRVKSIAQDYYSFLKTYELSSLQPENKDENDVLKPSNAQGNVKGGAGIIGGVFQREFRFLY